MDNTILKTIILFFLVPIYAFPQIKLTGKVVDNENLPIEFAEVILFENDTIPTNSELTNQEGHFEFSIQKGKYRIEIRQLGDIFYDSAIAIGKSTDLGTIKVTQTKILNEVVVTFRKQLIERKVDRLVFNAENSIAATGGDALQALKVTPGISVQNDQISMIGKSGMAVMVDGRIVQLSGEDLINYLRSISGNDIKNIEVITSPPAKYEAQGNSGLINIVLKKGNKNSLNNTVRASYVQTSYPAYTLGNTFNFRKNKLSLNTTIDAKTGYQGYKLKYAVYFPGAKNISEMNSKNKQDYTSGRLGIDYGLTDKASIGGIVQLYNSIPDSKDKSFINIYEDNSQLSSHILTNGNSDETSSTYSYNLHYIQRLDTLGRQISVDLDCFTFNENKDRIFDSKQYSYNVLSNSLIANNVGDQEITNYSTKIDIEHPTPWATMSYGGKLAFTDTKNNITYYDLSSGKPIIDPLQTDNFKYTEHTQALYFDIAKNFGEKWQTKVGLRFENTQTESYSVSYNRKHINNYHKFFPTTYILYLIDEDNFINFNYSRRINRPGFWELNPFRWYINANSYSEGNPFLQPSFNDNFELTYSYKQFLYTTLIGQITKNGFGQIPQVNEDNNQQIYVRKNYYTSYVYGVSQVYVFNRLNWLESSLQANAFYVGTQTSTSLSSPLPAQDGFGLSFSTNNSFLLNTKKTLIGELKFLYNAPSKALLYQQSNLMNLALGVRAFFLDRKLQCSFSINDVFRTSNPDYTTFTDNIKQVYNNYYDNRYFTIGIKYTFGNDKIRVEKRGFGNEDEQGRSQ